jgi:PadR family transcriptional regulator, regulatory protein PadR
VETRTDLMRGTLDLLILRSLLAMPLHGLGIARRISQITQGSFDVKPGSLFPALYRLEERGLVISAWGESDTRRRAKFYRMTRLGKTQLQAEEANWRRITVAISHALGSTS